MSDINTSKLFAKWKTLWGIAQAGPIIRRYFVMNFFDGVLTALGIVLGFFTTNIGVGKETLVNTALFTAIAIGISGLTGSHLAESTERKLNVIEMRKVLGLADMDGNESFSRKPKYSEKDIQKALGKFQLAPYGTTKDGPKSANAIRSLRLGRDEELSDFLYYKKPKKKDMESSKRKNVKVAKDAAVSKSRIMKAEKSLAIARGEKTESIEKKVRAKTAKKKKGTEKKPKKKGFFQRKKEKKDLPIFEEAQEFASKVAALIDGFSPFFGVIIVVLPFIFTPNQFMAMPEYITCFVITGVTLFLLGGYLARLSRESVIKYGLTMVLSAVFTSLLSLSFTVN